jgi:endoglucanase
VRGRAAAPLRLAVLALAVSVVLALLPGAASGRVAMGAYIRGADIHPGKIDRFADKVGRRPVVVGIYRDWGTGPVLEAEQLEEIWRRGAMPMVTLEPWSASLRSIARGRHDRYIRGMARRAARWGKPIMLRFAHEMNGNWYPWGTGTSAVTYKRAWRHLVRVFRHNGASNVLWIWCPYAGGDLPFSSRFPGGRWVDWVGLDGLNWGGAFGWHSFGEIFGGAYRRLTRLSHKPVILAEVGSGTVGGSKAAWLRRALFHTLPRMRRVHALVWWSASDPRGDIRVNSSRSALRVVRNALNRGRFQLERRGLLSR